MSNQMLLTNCAGRYLNALETELTRVAASDTPQPGQYRAAIRLCKKAMAKLKDQLRDSSFERTADEIRFFKELKPQFYSRYIYFIQLFNYSVQKPAGSSESQETYIRTELDELKTFFDHNRAFYAYYRAGMTQLDEAYFTRSGFDVHAELEDFEAEERFSTSHDYKLSKLMANEKYQNYLNQELAKLKAAGEDSNTPLPFSLPNWTATKTDAIELIYALKATGAINNGNIDISELVVLWEYMFQVDLKEYYHKFTDITRRKKDIPVFLNRLREGLLRWIDDKLSL
jgi:hypothetical protein